MKLSSANPSSEILKDEVIGEVMPVLVDDGVQTGCLPTELPEVDIKAPGDALRA